MNNLQDLITALAVVFTEVERLGLRVNVSISGVHKDIIQKLVKEHGGEYTSKISGFTYGEKFASGDVHFKFGEVLFNNIKDK